MPQKFAIFFLLCLFVIQACKKNNSIVKDEETQPVVETEPDNSLPFDTPLIDSLVVYKTANLVIQKLSDNVYEHISFLNTNDYGKVGCNGMVVVNGNEAVVFDTPTSDRGSYELVAFINDSLKSTTKAIIPTHFHADCVKGLEGFMEQNVPAYASNTTIDLLNANNKSYTKPIQGFDGKLELEVGDQKVYAGFVGEGHTIDNVIGYYPEGQIVFGGCLLKSVGSSEGFMGDSNATAWSESVRFLRDNYPTVTTFIPGHGDFGGSEILDYTAKLFDRYSNN